MKTKVAPESVRKILEQDISEFRLRRALRGMSEPERADLVLELAAHARRNAALIEVANGVADSLSLDILLPWLMEMVTRTVGAERATLFLYDAESAELFSRVLIGEAVGEVRVPSRLGIAGRVFSSGEAQIVADAYADPCFHVDVDRRTGYRTRNVLCAPIRNKRQDVIGVAQVLNKLNGNFDLEDQRVLESITQQAAAALENARLFERIELQQREEALLLDTTSAIASEILLDPLLEKILKAATDLLNADRGALFLYDSRTGELYSRAAGKLEAKEIRFPAHAGIAGECFSSGLPISIADAYADPRFNPEVDRVTSFRTRSILCMPITTRVGHKVGVMEILNKKGGLFGPADERRLRALCAQAAVSLENARLFEEVDAGRVFNENILRSMSGAVLALDAEHRVTKVNQAAGALLRRGEAQLAGLHIEEVFAGPNAWVPQSLARVCAGGTTDIVIDTDLLLHAGEAVSVNLTTVPLVDAADRRIGYLLIIDDITKEKRLRTSMSRYTSKAVADELLAGGQAVLGGTGREVSVLFADIRGFTAISERLGPRATVALLNDYFTNMVDVVFEHNGVLDKYVGDLMMAVFGSVRSESEDADNAVTVANRMMVRLRELNERGAASWGTTIQIGVGIATGDVVVGNIGSPKRLEYTVIGHRVNLADRLEGANKHYGTGILLCQFTARKLRRGALLRELDLIRVRGSTQPVAVFEALDYHTEKSFPRRSEVLEAFAEGLRLYRQREWARAEDSFRQACAAHPGDRPSRIFSERCRRYMLMPPPQNWDGVWTLGES